MTAAGWAGPGCGTGCGNAWASARRSVPRPLVTQRVFVEGVPGFSDDAAYLGLDFLLAALGEMAAPVTVRGAGSPRGLASRVSGSGGGR
jgi:hypothetical protein